jgi:hypothetical protein
VELDLPRSLLTSPVVQVSEEEKNRERQLQVILYRPQLVHTPPVPAPSPVIVQEPETTVADPQGEASGTGPDESTTDTQMVDVPALEGPSPESNGGNQDVELSLPLPEAMEIEDDTSVSEVTMGEAEDLVSEASLATPFLGQYQHTQDLQPLAPAPVSSFVFSAAQPAFIFTSAAPVTPADDTMDVDPQQANAEDDGVMEVDTTEPATATEFDEIIMEDATPSVIPRIRPALPPAAPEGPVGEAIMEDAEPSVIPGIRPALPPAAQEGPVGEAMDVEHHNSSDNDDDDEHPPSSAPAISTALPAVTQEMSAIVVAPAAPPVALPVSVLAAPAPAPVVQAASPVPAPAVQEEEEDPSKKGVKRKRPENQVQQMRKRTKAGIRDPVEEEDEEMDAWKPASSAVMALRRTAEPTGHFAGNVDWWGRMLFYSDGTEEETASAPATTPDDDYDPFADDDDMEDDVVQLSGPPAEHDPSSVALSIELDDDLDI